MANQFDELSKALASGVSRREALRRFGVGLAGALLASAGVRKASAAPSACAVICGKNAGISGPLHATCLQACRQCEADVTRICIGYGPFGPSQVICCPEGRTCCFDIAGRPTCCPEGRTCCFTA